YTERARGFVQSAQSLALREGHQQFTTEHLLKVLLDDEEGLAAGLIDRAGGNSREALRQVVRALASSIWRRRWPASSTMPRRSPRRRAIPLSPSSACFSRWRWRRGPKRPRSWPTQASPPRPSTP